MKLFKLFKNVQLYYCLPMYVIVLCPFLIMFIGCRFIAAPDDVVAGFDFFVPLLVAFSLISVVCAAFYITSNSDMIAASNNVSFRSRALNLLICSVLLSSLAAGAYVISAGIVQSYLNGLGFDGNTAYKTFMLRSKVNVCFFDGSSVCDNFFSGAAVYELVFICCAAIHYIMRCSEKLRLCS